MNSKKTRKALIGTFIGMMALTAASAATAGVAWFTTTRTATVSFPYASVQSNRGELRVGEFGTGGNTNSYAIPDNDQNFKGSTDSYSSKNGIDFYNAMLDVDGSELIGADGVNGIYVKDANAKVGEFAFSANTQATANTNLGVYAEQLKIKVVDQVTEVKAYSSELNADNTNVTLENNAEKIVSVTLVTEAYDEHDEQRSELVASTGYTWDGENAANKVVLTVALAEHQSVEVAYKYDASASAIAKSIRVAFFASNVETTKENVIDEDNLMLVWDTTHGTEEHHAIEVAAAKTAHDETHYIRATSLAYVDLQFPVEAKADITSVKVTPNGGEEATLDAAKYDIAANSRRLDLSAADVKRGDKIVVTYSAKTISKGNLTNAAAPVIDAYYAGNNLKDKATDGDLSDYGAYLGETDKDSPLNIVTRVWIEGTDEDHNEIGEKYLPNGEEAKDSIDITGHDYKISMDLSLVAIDVDAA